MLKIPPQRITIMDRDKIHQEIDEIFDSGMLAYGEKVERFENAFKNYIGTRYAIATTSCTTALEICYRYWNFNNVTSFLFSPTNTYAATVLPIANMSKRNAIVVFVDINKDLNMNIDRIINMKIPFNSIISIVHIGGSISKDIMKLVDFCEDNCIPLIEDAAHAHGSTLNGKKAGTFGNASCFSLYGTKIVTSGEGGMITTNDEGLDTFARRFRHHGRDYGTGDTRYQHVQYGSNYCMDEVRSIIGYYQLKHLDEFIQRREEIAKRYSEKVELVYNEGTNFYKIITYDNVKFKSPDISFSGSVYSTPLHRQPIFEKDYKDEDGFFKQSEWYCTNHKCLPVYNDMFDLEIDFIIDNMEIVK